MLPIKMLQTKQTYLNSRSVDIKLLENSESLFIEFIVDRNVRDVGRVVVVEAVYVFHDACAVGLYSCKINQLNYISRNIFRNLLNV